MSKWDYIRDFIPPKPAFLPVDYPDLTGKTVLITGSSAGIGKETTRLLLAQNATLVLFNRNQKKTEDSIEELKLSLNESHPDLSSTFDDRIITVYGDLSDLTTIKAAADEIKAKVKKLDIVILNAGVMSPPAGTVTKQGFELQIGANVFAHQLLVDLVTPLVKNAVSEENTPRVIFVSSAAHLSSPANGIDFERGFKDASISNTIESYGQSKAGNIYQAAIYAQENPEIIGLAVHPGYLASELGRSLPKIVNKIYYSLVYAPVYGSYTELFAALSPEVTIKDSSRYVAPWGYFRDVRKDIEEGMTNGTARKFLDEVEKEISSYK